MGDIGTHTPGCRWHVLRKPTKVELQATGSAPRCTRSLDLWQALAIHPCAVPRIIINYPGTGGSQDGYCGKHRQIAEILQSRSVGAVIRMDNPGTAPYDYASWLRDRLRHVIQFALETATDICGSHAPEIYLMGFSSGATSIACVAHEFDQVSNILLLSPIVNRKRGGPWEELKRYREKIAVVVGDGDTVAPPSVSEQFYRTAENCSRRRLEIVPGCDHQFQGERNARILSNLAVWAFGDDRAFPSPDAGVTLYSDAPSVHMVHACPSPVADRAGVHSAVFLHGRLSGGGVERPAIQCASFLQALATRGVETWMPEYSDLYPECSHEITGRRPGPVSAAVVKSLSYLPVREGGKLALIAYSFGCVFAADLLLVDEASRFDRLVLIAPVVPRSAREDWPKPVVNIPTLTIWGTHDNRVGNPSWLADCFPEHEFAPIEGGNHLYYVLPSPMDRFDENPATIPRAEQQRLAAEHIVRFLGTSSPCRSWRLEERVTGETVDLTEQCKAKAVTSEKSYWYYDQRQQ